MRRAWAILCLILAGSPALAQNTFKTGAWSGSPTFNGQQFSHCAIGKTYGDGTVLVVQLTPQLELYVGARKPAWDMEPSQYQLSFEIDQAFKKTFSGSVAAGSRNTIWFTIGNDAEFRRAFAAGTNMTWVGNQGTRIPFNLAGADNAMRKLLACTALYGAE
jgi:hypothetical protein